MESVGLYWLLGHAPIAAALILGLFWAALAHPERIRNMVEFRLSALALGTSIAATAIVPLALYVHFSGDRRAGLGAAVYLCAIPPSLTMLALLLGLDSVTPRRTRPPTTLPTEPR